MFITYLEDNKRAKDQDVAIMYSFCALCAQVQVEYFDLVQGRL
jgi:hypothetical protein